MWSGASRLGRHVDVICSPRQQRHLRISAPHKAENQSNRDLKISGKLTEGFNVLLPSLILEESILAPRKAATNSPCSTKDLGAKAADGGLGGLSLAETPSSATTIFHVLPTPLFYLKTQT